MIGSSKEKIAAINGLNDAKVALRNAIMMDTKLTGNFRAIGWYIADLIRDEEGFGYAYPSQEHIAEKMGFTVRTVQRAKPALIARGYFVVEDSNGDGRNDRYFPGPAFFDRKPPDKMSGEPPQPPDKKDETTRQFRQKPPDKKGVLSSLRYPENYPIGGDGDGDDARERATSLPSIDSETNGLCDKILVKIDAEAGSPLSVEAPRVVQNWLGKGWSSDVILAGVKMGMRSCPDGPPNTLRYFEKPIGRLLAELTGPVPKTEIVPATGRRARAERPLTEFQRGRQELNEIRSDLDNFASRGSSGPGSSRRVEVVDVAASAARAPPAASRVLAAGAPAPRAQSPANRPAARKRPDPRTGEYEREIAAIIGWDCLSELPATRREDLCRRWPVGRVPPEELAAMKLDNQRSIAARKISTG